MYHVEKRTATGETKSRLKRAVDLYTIHREPHAPKKGKSNGRHDVGVCGGGKGLVDAGGRAGRVGVAAQAGAGVADDESTEFPRGAVESE